jgi:hypothetical protein
MKRFVPTSQPVLEALQWFGLLAPAVAFAGEHVIGFGATLVQCNPAGGTGWSIEPRLYQLATTAVSAGIVVLAIVASALAYLATKELHYEDDPPRGRVRFLSTAALVSGPLFLALILLNGIGASVPPTCHQA